MATVFEKVIRIKETGAKQATSNIKDMVKAGLTIGAVVVVAKKLTDQLKKSAEASIAQEQIFKKLETAVNLTGASYNDNEKALKDLFATQQAFTQYGDTDSAEMLTSLMQLTGDYSKAVEGLTVAQDLAASGLFDTGTAARYVGLAMQGEITVLGRYIAEFKQSNPEMAKLTTQAEKAEYAMRILNEKFGGTARENVKTTAGAIQQMKNYAGDLQEEIGDRLSPSIVKITEKMTGFIKSIINSDLETATEQLQAMGATMQEIAALQTAQSLSDAIEQINDGTKELNANLISTKLPKEIVEQFGQLETRVTDLGDGIATTFDIILTKSPEETLNDINDAYKNLGISSRALIPEYLELQVKGEDLTKAEKRRRDEIERTIATNDKNRDRLNLLRESLANIIDGENTLVQTKKELIDETNNLNSSLTNLEKTTEGNTEQLGYMEDKIVELIPLVEELMKELDYVDSDLDFSGLVPDDMILTDVQKFVKKYKNEIEAVEMTINSLASGSAEIWGNIIEARYEKELRAMKEMTEYKQADVDKRKKMEQDLNEEYAAERTKQAKFAKAMALMEATVNTASAVMKSFTVDPTGILAIATGVAGLAQIGIIASEPIPAYATGGYVDRPQLALVGESGGEGILNASTTQRLGGRAGIDALNKGGSVGNTLIMNFNNLSIWDENQLDRLAEQISDRSKLGFNEIEVKYN